MIRAGEEIRFLFPDIYFVKNGLWNGEKDTKAITIDGVLQKDGWYWLGDGMDDGIGPFSSKKSALIDFFLELIEDNLD